MGYYREHATAETVNEEGTPMEMLVIGDAARVQKYLPDLPIVRDTRIIVAERGAADDELVTLAPNADFIMADAISPVSGYLMERLPNLKLVHSEGVGYNAIDTEAAARLGIAVCNNAGVNAGAVAEQTVLLMLACLRDIVAGDAAVRDGRQIQTKESMMVQGIRELGDCTVGFVGFGAIAQATAERLAPWGCSMVYNKRTPLPATDEARLNASYRDLDDLLAESDIVSLHVPVTPTTEGMVDDAFLAKMKPGSILINTARGDIVDQEALVRALESGYLSAAGLDTMTPEPVQTDNPLLNMTPQGSARTVFSPHIGGVTEGMFYRAHRTVWENIARIAAGEEPVNRIV